MIGCLRTRVRKQPIIALYFESQNELKLYNLAAWLLRNWQIWLGSFEFVLQNFTLVPKYLFEWNEYLIIYNGWEADLK